MQLLDWANSTYWVAWGILPFFGVNLGFWCPALLLEWLLSRVLRAEAAERAAKGSGGVWARCFRTVSYGGTSRAQALAEARYKVSWTKQLCAAAWQISGPMAMLGSAAGACVLPWLVPYPSKTLPGPWEFICQMAVMEVAGDFALYWGHRIQHESSYLWENFHSHHHTVQ